MFDLFSATVRSLLGNDVAGHGLRVYPDDTFLVSYPKSGNTWLRFLVANLVHPARPITLVEADQLIPAVDGKSKRFFQLMPRPRIIKSHYPFDSRYKRVIYVVRDPKDVAVSQYHYQIKRKVLNEDHPVDEFVSRFVAGEVCPYGSWGENVASWLAARPADPTFLLVRYEDMLANPLSEAGRIARFLGIDSDPASRAQAIERSSAPRMRSLEKEEAGKWDSTRETRQDRSFVRSAKAGDWVYSLTESSIARIEAAWGPLMSFLGYELVLGSAKAKVAGLLPSILRPSGG